MPPPDPGAPPARPASSLTRAAPTPSRPAAPRGSKHSSLGAQLRPATHRSRRAGWKEKLLRETVGAIDTHVPRTLTLKLPVRLDAIAWLHSEVDHSFLRKHFPDKSDEWIRQTLSKVGSFLQQPRERHPNPSMRSEMMLVIETHVEVRRRPPRPPRAHAARAAEPRRPHSTHTPSRPAPRRTPRPAQPRLYPGRFSNFCGSQCMVKPLRHFLHEMTVGLDMTNNLPKNVEWTGICLLQFDPAVAECQTFYNDNRAECWVVHMAADDVTAPEAKQRFLALYTLNYSAGQHIHSRDPFFRTMQRELSEYQRLLFHHPAMRPLANLCRDHHNPGGSFVMRWHTMLESVEWQAARARLESVDTQAVLKAALDLPPGAPDVAVVGHIFDEIKIGAALGEDGEAVSPLEKPEVKARVCGMLTEAVAAKLPGMRMVWDVKASDPCIRDKSGTVIGMLPGPTGGSPLDDAFWQSEGYGVPAYNSRMRYFASVLIKVDNKYVLLSHEPGLANRVVTREQVVGRFEHLCVKLPKTKEPTSDGQQHADEYVKVCPILNFLRGNPYMQFFDGFIFAPHGAVVPGSASHYNLWPRSWEAAATPITDPPDVLERKLETCLDAIFNICGDSVAT